MAVNLEPIHRALADQIQAYLGRQTNVSPFPDGSTIFPCITVHSDPAGYLEPYSTFGPNGYVDLKFRLKVELAAGDVESVCIKMAAYLSIGTGNLSSIFDAIRSDKTLGGLIDDIKPEQFQWDTESDPTVAWIPLLLIVKKVGAQP